MERSSRFTDLATLLQSFRSADKRSKMTSNLLKPLPPAPPVSPATSAFLRARSMDAKTRRGLSLDGNPAEGEMSQRRRTAIVRVPSRNKGGNYPKAEPMPKSGHHSLVPARKPSKRGSVNKSNSPTRSKTPVTPPRRRESSRVELPCWSTLPRASTFSTLDDIAVETITVGLERANRSPGGSSTDDTMVGDDDEFTVMIEPVPSKAIRKSQLKLSVHDPGSTTDLAHFLKTTGPANGRPKTPAEEHSERKLRKLVALGKFRKRDVAPGEETAEEIVFNSNDTSRIVQKVSKDGTRYLHIVTSPTLGSAEFQPKIKTVANTPMLDHIEIDPLDQWIDSFTFADPGAPIQSNSSPLQKLMMDSKCPTPILPNISLAEAPPLHRSPTSLPSLRYSPPGEQIQRPKTANPETQVPRKPVPYSEVSPKSAPPVPTVPQWHYAPPHVAPVSLFPGLIPAAAAPGALPALAAEPPLAPRTPVPTDFPAPPSSTSTSTSTSAEAEVLRLRGQLESAERQNRLLEAALQAVLWTAGSLNGCPCGSHSPARSERASQSASSDQETRRPSASSVASTASALDVYKETRI